MFTIDPNLKSSIDAAVASGQNTKVIRASAATGLGDGLTLTSNIAIHSGPRPYGYVELNGYPVIIGDTCAIKPHAEDGRRYIYDHNEWVRTVEAFNGVKPALYASTSMGRTASQGNADFTRSDMMAVFKET